MKKLEIIIRPESLEDLKNVLTENNCSGMTVMPVMGCGMQKGSRTGSFQKESPAGINLIPKMLVTAVITDDILESILKDIKEKISACRVGDGKVFVSDICGAMRIRTGERGEKAIESRRK